MSYDTLGDGDLLPQAERILRQSTREHGWTAIKTTEIVDRLWDREPRVSVRQASVFTLTSPEQAFVHVPLVAKKYAMRGWYSVSEKAIAASREFEANTVLAYIKELGSIRVSDPRTAKADSIMGPYLRMHERYFGWNIADTKPLEEWLEQPVITRQETLG